MPSLVVPNASAFVRITESSTSSLPNDVHDVGNQVDDRLARCDEVLACQPRLPDGAVVEDDRIAGEEVGDRTPVPQSVRTPEVAEPTERVLVLGALARAVAVLQLLERAGDVVLVEQDRGEDPTVVVDLSDTEHRDLEPVRAGEPNSGETQSLTAYRQHLVCHDLVEHLDDVRRCCEELLADVVGPNVTDRRSRAS